MAGPSQSPQPILALSSRREAAGISLNQIIESTKISRHFLEAIEAERFGELPGGIFDTSYIRQYAAAIGMDPSPVLDLYRKRTGQSQAQPSNEGNKTAEKGSSHRGFRFSTL
ncbi:MAG: helix-turn-helix domain-containing protein [Bryobacteraceae bacterium]|nr:helix-turn-helix domain-containing protein [Bryobacteraceae bacterium]